MSFGKLANDVTSELKLPKDSRANLNIYLGEIDWVAFHALVPAAIHYQPIPEFAPVQRDLALVAPSMECGTLVTEMQRACKQLTKGRAVRHLPRRKARRGQEEHGVQPVLPAR